ncbi:MAG: hypothetical protein AAF298_16960 [Cyanobacteria bacterium P01_A01_bin.40]
MIVGKCDRCFLYYLVKCDRALQLQDEGMEYDASLYYAKLRLLFFLSEIALSQV